MTQTASITHSSIVTGLCFFPLTNPSTSPYAAVLANLAERHPDREPHPYTLDHRLFSDTSSQLPGADVKQRLYTQILHLSSNPKSTFVGVTAPVSSESKHSDPASNTALVTIPVGSADNFTGLILRKLQPEWYHRQSEVIENGMSIQGDGMKFSFGEVRVSQRSQASAGSLRGVLIEFEQTFDHVDPPDSEDGEAENYEEILFPSLLRPLLGQYLKGVPIVADDKRFRVCRTRKFHHDTGRPEYEDAEKIAKLYMEVLRNTRA